MKFGKFRTANEGETIADYFRNATSKAAKKMGVSNESVIQGFIARSIEQAKGDQTKLNNAFDYAVQQFAAKGDLRLCTSDVFVAEAA